ncbi:MAG: hypothetical protein WBP40_00065 [Candidatus Moraniibacteriota bacterium]
MEPDVEAKLNAIAERQEQAFVSIEKTRKYMLWSFIMQLAVVILPLIILMFAVPFLLSSLSNLSGLYQGL